MRLSSMAWSNFKGNMYRYIMFFLSNSFAVAAFFIFINFLMHPAIDINNLGGHSVSAMGAAMAIKLCLIIIIGFSVLFVGYSTSIFLNSRGKEFGLLSLYGMTKNQIRKYVFMENSIISIISVVTGILTGILFSKLFLMSMEYFLDIELAFNISLKALGLTGILFFLLFEIINIFILLKIRDKEIVEQIKTSKIPKKIPEFSRKKAILGIVLLIIGYIMAWLVKGALVVLGMIPITIIVVIGTYFIFTEFSILITDRLIKKDSIIYDNTNLVVVSQLIFKLQDTAKVLFLAAILGAITFTATETVFSFYTEVDTIVGIDTVEDIAIYQDGNNLEDEKTLGYIEYRLKEDIETKDIYSIKGIKALNKDYKKGNRVQEYTNIISENDYNYLAEKYNEEQIDIGEGNIVYNYPHEIIEFGGDIEDFRRLDEEQVNLEIAGDFRQFNIDKDIEERKGSIISTYKVSAGDYFILNDKDYKELENIIDDNSRFKFTAIRYDDHRNAYDASLELFNEFKDTDYEGRIFLKSISYVETRKSFGMTLFIGFFISFLFLIAAGSVIYFKLFNDIEEDRKDYNILRKIGIKESELNKIITRQIGIIFFLPFIFATLHSLFALKSLSNLLRMNLIKNGIIVMIGYLIFQLIYFIFIRKSYIDRINYQV